MQACRQVGRQYLTDQLTLSQPDGQIMPTTVLPAPRIFRPCDGPELSLLDNKLGQNSDYYNSDCLCSPVIFHKRMSKLAFQDQVGYNYCLQLKKNCDQPH